jgi:hypothetical protein
MATEFKCEYCNATVDKNATLVHTKGYYGLWDLDCCICAACFKHFKGMLEKVKSQKSWTGWKDLEQEVDSLKKEKEMLETELKFLRHEDPICNRLRATDRHTEVLTVLAKGCDSIMAHRSILISRSDVLKTFLTSEGYRREILNKKDPQIQLTVQLHPTSFRAFIHFLNTAELNPEVLKDHAPELMIAGNVYNIQLLKRKCEDYIVKHMTRDNTIYNLKVAKQCDSEAIKVAAVKQMQINPTEFVNGEDYQALRKDYPAALADAFDCMLRDHPPREPEEKKPTASKGSDPGSGPGSDPTINSSLPWDRYAVETSIRTLGMCTCSVHPFGHSAAPGVECRGVRFHTATAQPSTVHTGL